MRTNTDPEGIWEELGRGQRYKESLDLYETVRRNENFYLGKQWEGVKAPDLEKPVLNFIRRVVTYFISMIVSDDVAVSFTPFSPIPGDRTPELLAQEVTRVMERVKAKSKNRLALRNAAVDGDAAAYFWFDPEAKTGRLGDGEIRMELIDNTRVIFGAPFRAEVQEQPYLLLVRRSFLSTLRERAKEAGSPDWEALAPDGEEPYPGEDASGGMVTSVVKLYREGGTVHMTEAARTGVVVPPRDTGLTLYPVAWMSWEGAKDSCHGVSPITGLIPNQIFVNKLWAMFMQHQKSMAFPKIFYDATKVNGWSNRVGEAIAVSGDPREAFATSFRAGDFSGQAMELVEKTIAYTKEFMGASDAALGSVRPNNTSAIIAVQKASSAPLELQRMTFLQFVEDCVRIIVDLIRQNYGVRQARLLEEDGTARLVLADFGALPYGAMDLAVEVGSSAYWSELAQVQTLDSLFAKGIITDAATYLEGVPDQYVPHKEKLLRRLRQREAAQRAPEEPAPTPAPAPAGG